MNKYWKTLSMRWLTLALASLCAASGLAQQRKAPPSPSAGEDFFIISSVDQAKHALVLKMPTEVTLLMTVTDHTVYLDEKGKPIPFSDLRAGDTVFITHQKKADGADLALRIRKGEMTVEELHRRYLRFAAPQANPGTKQ